MTKVLVLYYSAYGHIEAMAGAIAEGAASRRHGRHQARAGTGAAGGGGRLVLQG